MNYTMNPDDMVFNSVKDKVILNDEEPVSHACQIFFVWYLPNKWMNGEIG